MAVDRQTLIHARSLPATPDWVAYGTGTNYLFGNSVASAGDVNGDGYTDIIIGSPGAADGQDQEGLAFVYHGSAQGLPDSPNWMGESDQMNAYFGYSVASAGDVNGDGYDDVIVGAHFYSNGEVNEGRVFVYDGSASGLSPVAAWSVEGNQTRAYYGYSVAGAGDVNGDGYDDVIVGSYGYSNGQSKEGKVFVYHGSASGLAAEPAWTSEGEQADAFYGYSVSTAGDVNGDGFADVIIGARQYDGSAFDGGGAFVYLGSATGLSGTPAWSAFGNQKSALFGESVSTSGDVNGDGYDDIIVGAIFTRTGNRTKGECSFIMAGQKGSPLRRSGRPKAIKREDTWDSLFLPLVIRMETDMLILS